MMLAPRCEAQPTLLPQVAPRVRWRSCDGAWGFRSGGAFGRRIMAFLAAVAWLKVSGLRHAQRFEVPASVDGHRLDDHAHVVAALIEQRGAPGSKPMRALLKHRHLARA